MQGTEYREKKSVKWKNWKMQGKQFDSETMTRYNASRDYIALYLAREQ